MTDINARRALCALPCTLDGKPAAISGAAREFATVRDLKTGQGADWAWDTVARVMAHDAAFRL